MGDAARVRDSQFITPCARTYYDQRGGAACAAQGIQFILLDRLRSPSRSRILDMIEKKVEIGQGVPTLLCEHWATLSGDLAGCIRQYIPSQLRGLVSVDDILHDVWLDAVRQLRGYAHENYDGLYNWLRRIAIGKTVDAVRTLTCKRQGGCDNTLPQVAVNSSLFDVFGVIPSKVRTPSSLCAIVESIGSVRRVLSKLREPARTMVQMHYLEGASDHEIAKLFNVTLGTVRSLIHRSRLKLRRLLGSSSKFYSK